MITCFFWVVRMFQCQIVSNHISWLKVNLAGICRTKILINYGCFGTGDDVFPGPTHTTIYIYTLEKTHNHLGES